MYLWFQKEKKYSIILMKPAALTETEGQNYTSTIFFFFLIYVLCPLLIYSLDLLHSLCLFMKKYFLISLLKKGIWCFDLISLLNVLQNLKIGLHSAMFIREIPNCSMCPSKIRFKPGCERQLSCYITNKLTSGRH